MRWLEGAHLLTQALYWKRTRDLPQREAAYAVGMMVNVAILTTGSPLRTFLSAVVLHQDWQKALRAEIGSVLSEEDRLIGLENAPKLPIPRSITKECLR